MDGWLGDVKYAKVPRNAYLRSRTTVVKELSSIS